MSEITSADGEKLPRPLWRHLIIRNPLYDIDLVKVDKEIQKLPPSKQQEAMDRQMRKWERVEIISADEDCQCIETGDVCLTTAQDAVSAIKILDGEFLMVRENIFKAIW